MARLARDLDRPDQRGVVKRVKHWITETCLAEAVATYPRRVAVLPTQDAEFD